MKKQHVTLSAEDQKYLKTLLSKGSLKARKYKRALALLELHKGQTIQAVVDLLGMSYPTVWGWSKKYTLSGLSFLEDKARSGRPIVIDGEMRAKITALACSEPPVGHGTWSLRLLADRAVELGYCEQVSYVQVGEILKKHSKASLEG